MQVCVIFLKEKFREKQERVSETVIPSPQARPLAGLNPTSLGPGATRAAEPDAASKCPAISNI